VANLDAPSCSPLERTIHEPVDGSLAEKAEYWAARLERSRGTRDYWHAFEKKKLFAALAKGDAERAARTGSR
jgi:hypothetical protein